MSVDEAASFAQFVYPFSFEAASFGALAEALGRAHWPGRERPLAVWEPGSFPQGDLMAHVANYLSVTPGSPATAAIWNMTHDALHASSGLGAGADWTTTYPRGELPIRFDLAQIVLFRVGIGFFILRVRPLSSEISAWLDFLHYFRFVGGRGDVQVRARRRTGRDVSEPFFPAVAGGLERHQDGAGQVRELIDACLRTASVAGDDRAWWRDVYVPGQLIPYSGLFVDALAQPELTVLVYRLGNIFHSRQEIHPAAEDLDLSDEADLLSYAEGQWFVFSLGGGTFLASGPPQTPFFSRTLPGHLKQDYFLAFLLALHQRFALMTFSDDVAAHWVDLPESLEEDAREAAFRRIRDRLLMFTARGYFAQVMQLDHHHRYYRKWQDLFQLDRLYREVTDEVREMHDVLTTREAERTRRRDRESERMLKRFELAMSLFAVGFGGPTIAWQFLILTQVQASRGTALATGLAGALAVLIVVGFFLLFSRGALTGRPGKTGDEALK